VIFVYKIKRNEDSLFVLREFFLFLVWDEWDL